MQKKEKAESCAGIRGPQSRMGKAGIPYGGQAVIGSAAGAAWVFSWVCLMAECPCRLPSKPYLRNAAGGALLRVRKSKPLLHRGT